VTAWTVNDVDGRESDQAVMRRVTRNGYGDVHGGSSVQMRKKARMPGLKYPTRAQAPCDGALLLGVGDVMCRARHNMGYLIYLVKFTLQPMAASHLPGVNRLPVRVPDRNAVRRTRRGPSRDRTPVRVHGCTAATTARHGSTTGRIDRGTLIFLITAVNRQDDQDVVLYT